MNGASEIGSLLYCQKLCQDFFTYCFISPSYDEIPRSYKGLGRVAKTPSKESNSQLSDALSIMHCTQWSHNKK